MVGWNTGCSPERAAQIIDKYREQPMRTAQEIMKEALETGKITETNMDIDEHNDPETNRLRHIIRERDKMIDELLALLNEMTDKVIANVKEQHQRLVFDIENRTPVD